MYWTNIAQVLMGVCIVFMAFVTVMVLCARPEDSLLSESKSRLHVVFSHTGFRSEGKPCHETRETTALRLVSNKPRAFS